MDEEYVVYWGSEEESVFSVTDQSSENMIATVTYGSDALLNDETIQVTESI